MKKLIAGALGAAVLAPMSALAATSGFDGTWKEDTSTLKMSGTPVTFLLANGMYECNCVPKIRVKADGKPQAIVGHPGEDHVAIDVKDDHTVLITYLDQGKTVSSITWNVAPDGKLAHDEFMRTTPTGQQISGKYEFRRVKAGPKGANALSGSWMPNSMSVSENDLSMTVKTNGKEITVSSGAGDAVTARLGGAAAPVSGVSGKVMAAFAMKGPHLLTETDTRDGKVTLVASYTLSPDGKTLAVSERRPVLGRYSTYTMVRQ